MCVCVCWRLVNAAAFHVAVGAVAVILYGYDSVRLAIITLSDHWKLVILYIAVSGS